jgi:hypothetical protein
MRYNMAGWPREMEVWLACASGGEGGIRTRVPDLSDHPISSRRRYDRFGTSPASSYVS